MVPSDNTKQLDFYGDRLSHAYIAGGSAVDTIAMAAVCSGNAAIKPCLNCTHCDKASRHIHPDVTVVNKLPDKREIIVDQIRELKKDVVVIPCESSRKVYIINDANTMNRNAQNALLQILEEPPAHAVFVLNTDNPGDLLPTVQSRCVEIKKRTGPVLPDQTVMEIASEFFSALESGNVSLSTFMFRLEKLNKDDLGSFLEAARGQMPARLRAAMKDNCRTQKEALYRAEKVFLEAADMLSLNVSAGHISGLICASLISI